MNECQGSVKNALPLPNYIYAVLNLLIHSTSKCLEELCNVYDIHLNPETLNVKIKFLLSWTGRDYIIASKNNVY